MNLRIGQKVVCVDDSPSRHKRDYQLTLRAVYTVRGIDPENGTGIYLVEIPDSPPPRGFRYPRGWCPHRFRPAVEPKTDISIFKKMLTPFEIRKAKKELV